MPSKTNIKDLQKFERTIFKKGNYKIVFFHIPYAFIKIQNNSQDKLIYSFFYAKRKM